MKPDKGSRGNLDQPSWRNAELETAIADAPNEDARYRTYAEWFEARGDAHRAVALRVLGGKAAGTDLEKDAARLAAGVGAWLSEAGPSEEFDWVPERPATPAEVRTARATGEDGQWLTTFLSAWSTSSPFVPNDDVVNDMAASDVIADDLALPQGATLENISFERVETNQYGHQGVNGVLLLGYVDALTAFDLLASRIEGFDLEDVRCKEREEIFLSYEADSWTPLTRFGALQPLFANRALNEGEELKRGGASVPLPTLLRELGAIVSAAWTNSTCECVYELYRFERGWLLFYMPQ